MACPPAAFTDGALFDDNPSGAGAPRRAVTAAGGPMTATRQLRLGAFKRPVSIHTAWRRYPGSAPDADFNLGRLAAFARTLERGCFDAFFMADRPAVLNMPMDALKRSATVASFDPLTLLPALATVTDRLGLIATASATGAQAGTPACRARPTGSSGRTPPQPPDAAA